ncbi:MAG: MFS transporter [Candidatus Heimdallarchaeota archaeon]|nr:MFS transporter [Candidatus Heimdallarchaeota archaeon]
MAEKSATDLENKLLSNNLDDSKTFVHYLLFFSGQQFSILGSSVVSFVLIWWITEVTQSELMLGLASLASLGPYLLVMPFSGVIADRANRKLLLLTVDLLQSLFTVGLTIIFMVYYTPGSTQNQTLLITSIFITLGLRGVMQAFHSPVVSTLIPTMVPQKHLSRMNGVNFLLNGIIQVIGPILGAQFLKLFGVSLTMWIDIITFGIAIIPLLLIKIPAVIRDVDLKKQKFREQFTDGIKVVKEIKGLFAMIITATVINFFFVPVGTLMPLFVNKVHSGTEDDYAIVMVLLQIGIILGGLFMTFFKGFKNRVRTAIICIFVAFLGEALLLTIPSSINARFWIIGSLLLVSIFPIPIANVSFNTSIQMIIPKDKMGRVSSVLSFISSAISPIGMFLSGLIGEYIPIGLLYLISAAMGIVTTAMLYFFTPARNLDKVINEKAAKLEAEAVLKTKKEEKENEIIIDKDQSRDELKIISLTEEVISYEGLTNK